MKTLRRAYAALIYLFLYLPLVVMAAHSFNASKYSLAWKGFTLKWYAKLISSSSLLDAAGHTMTVAVVSATLASAMGVLVALTLYRYKFPLRRGLFATLFIMMMSPDIVIGISLLVLFLAAGAALGFWTLLLAHITLCLPFTTATVYARFKTMDASVLDAARDLGADDVRVFRHIILPMAAPAVLASWLLAFTISLDDVIISFFTTGPTYDVLPLKIYSMVRLGVKPEVNAMCVVMIVLTVAAVLMTRRLVRRKP